MMSLYKLSILCALASCFVAVIKQFYSKKNSVIANFLTVCKLTLHGYILHEPAGKKFYIHLFKFFMDNKVSM